MIVHEQGSFEANKKSYNEAFEISVRRMVMPNLEQETREDGESVYTVKDLDGLIISVMDFVIENNDKKI